MKHNHRSAALMMAALLALFTAGVGCSDTSTPPPADQVYSVRGIIDEMPEPNEPHPEMMIQHEAIHNFANGQGEIVGMNSMTMGFPLAAGVDVQGLKAGDPVELTFEVRWKANPRLQITRIAALPQGTQLEFGKASPNQAADATSPTLIQR